MKKYIKSKILSELIILALPIVLQMIVQNSFIFIDTFMIGKLGSKEIAAVGAINQSLFFIIIIHFSLSSGLQIFTSQYYGNNQKLKITKLLSSFILISFIIGIFILFFLNHFIYDILKFYNIKNDIFNICMDYFKFIKYNYLILGITFIFSNVLGTIGRTKETLKISIVSALVNTFTNYILIFGNLGAPKLGVSGAAIGTIISTIVSIILYLKIFVKGIEEIFFRIKYLFYFEVAFFKKFIRYSMPLFIQEIVWVTGVQTYTYYFNKLGTNAIASRNILLQIDTFFLFISWGFGIGTSIIIGRELGAKQFKRAYIKSVKYIRFIFKISIAVAFTMLIFTKISLNFLNINKEIFDNCLNTIYLTSLLIIIKSFNITMIIGILRSAGDTKNTLFIESSSLWFGVPIIIIVNYFFKLTFFEMWFFTSLEEYIKFYLSYRRFISKKWIKRVI